MDVKLRVVSFSLPSPKRLRNVSADSVNTTICALTLEQKHTQDFTTQQVLLPFGAAGCGTHTGEIQGVAQHGVHPAEDVRVAAGGQGRRVGVRAFRPAGIVSLQ